MNFTFYNYRSWLQLNKSGPSVGQWEIETVVVEKKECKIKYLAICLLKKCISICIFRPNSIFNVLERKHIFVVPSR